MPRQHAVDDMRFDGSTYTASEASGMMWSLEDMRDALDARGVPDELVSTWTLQEELWRSWEGCHASSPLQLEVREGALKFLQFMLSTSGLDHKSLFDAAMLLDLYLMKTQTPEITNVLPETCAAVTLLVMKAELGPKAMQGMPLDFSDDVDSFSMWLETNGFAQNGFRVASSVDIIISREAEIIETLDWQVKFPTSEAWISVFVSRFDVLTQSRYAHALTYAWWHSISAAGFMIRKRALSRNMPPKRFAVGLVCLILASGDVVSFDCLRPSSLGSEQWMQVMLEAGLHCRKLECTSLGDHHTVMPAFLTWATGEGTAIMSDHCHAVALAMRCAMQGNDNGSSAQVVQV